MQHPPPAPPPPPTRRSINPIRSPCPAAQHHLRHRDLALPGTRGLPRILDQRDEAPGGDERGARHAQGVRGLGATRCKKTLRTKWKTSAVLPDTSIVVTASTWEGEQIHYLQKPGSKERSTSHVQMEPRGAGEETVWSCSFNVFRKEGIASAPLLISSVVHSLHRKMAVTPKSSLCPHARDLSLWPPEDMTCQKIWMREYFRTPVNMLTRS